MEVLATPRGMAAGYKTRQDKSVLAVQTSPYFSGNTSDSEWEGCGSDSRRSTKNIPFIFSNLLFAGLKNS